MEVTFPDNVNRKMKDFISKLTRTNPNDRPDFKIVPEEILETCEFKGDDKFRSVWEDNFGSRETIHLIEFVLKFYEKYNTKPGPLEKIQSSATYKCFKAIMNPHEGLINKDGFERFISLFSPLEDEGKDIIGKSKDLLKRKSFWGYLSESEANLVLSKSDHSRTYIIRFSVAKGSQGKLTISWSDQKKGKNPKHYRFYHSKLDEIENNMKKGGYKNGIKNMDDLDFKSCHSLFKDGSKEIILTQLPQEISYIQQHWEDYSKSLEGVEGTTIDEMLDEGGKEKPKKVGGGGEKPAKKPKKDNKKPKKR